MIKVENGKTEINGNIFDLAVDLLYILKALAKNTDEAERDIILATIRKSVTEDF